MKILIVEDDQIIRHAFKRALLSRGHDVFLAKDGQEGLELWKVQKPNLVLLDVVMPKLNGLQILEMRKDLPSAKVVVMSAYMGDPSLWEHLKTLADMSLTKPFENVFEIVQKFEKLI